MSSPGVVVRGPIRAGYSEVLTADFLQFVAELHRNFNIRRKDLLNVRKARQARLDAGEKPDFLPVSTFSKYPYFII